MHLTIAQAGPIGLLAVTVSAGAGAILGFREKILRYKAAGFIATFGLLLSPLGLLVASRIPNQPLSLIFSGVLSYVAIRMLIQAYRELNGIVIEEPKTQACILDQSIGKLTWTLPCARSLAIAGTIAGFLSGLLGVGGGFVIVPSLKKVTNLQMRSIVATSFGVLTIVSFGGVVVASINDNMNWIIAIPFASGSLLGMLIGSIFSKKISGPRLQQIFAVFALLTAGLMTLKAFELIIS